MGTWRAEWLAPVGILAVGAVIYHGADERTSIEESGSVRTVHHRRFNQFFWTEASPLPAGKVVRDFDESLAALSVKLPAPIKDRREKVVHSLYPTEDSYSLVVKLPEAEARAACRAFEKQFPKMLIDRAANSWSAQHSNFPKQPSTFVMLNARQLSGGEWEFTCTTRTLVDGVRPI